MFVTAFPIQYGRAPHGPIWNIPAGTACRLASNLPKVAGKARYWLDGTPPGYEGNPAFQADLAMGILIESQDVKRVRSPARQPKIAVEVMNYQSISVPAKGVQS